jgi:hypothetical protein
VLIGAFTLSEISFFAFSFLSQFPTGNSGAGGAGSSSGSGSATKTPTKFDVAESRSRTPTPVSASDSLGRSDFGYGAASKCRVPWMTKYEWQQRGFVAPQIATGKGSGKGSGAQAFKNKAAPNFSTEELRATLQCAINEGMYIDKAGGASSDKCWKKVFKACQIASAQNPVCVGFGGENIIFVRTISRLHTLLSCLVDS